MLWQNVQTKDKSPQSGRVPHLQHSHGENLPHLSELPGPADLATCLAEVPHLSCEHNQEKKRNRTVRLVIPPRWDTSPTWGHPSLCEQALNSQSLHHVENNFFHRKTPVRICCVLNRS